MVGSKWALKYEEMSTVSGQREKRPGSGSTFLFVVVVALVTALPLSMLVRPIGQSTMHR